MDSFYWHDYEAFGIDPKRDRPSQFAGVRTDRDFNIIGEPLCIYCKPPLDYLPQPEACLLTGITPQLALEKGLCEAEFIKKIHGELAQPGTCALGYNSLRFDDEVTRNTLYRNFYDPYAREWQNGNSRWDLIDLVRAARALRPEGIVWPLNAEGQPSLRLEDLTAANGIQHQGAHDALVDVYATLELAKLIKKAQPKLFDYLFEHRVKREVQNLVNVGSFEPFVHISGMYSVQKNCLGVVVALCEHPTDSNGILVYDLSVDPQALIELSSDEIKYRLFTPVSELSEGCERIAIKTLHVNRCPVVVPLKVLRKPDCNRLQVDLDQCMQNLQSIKSATTIQDKLAAVYSGKPADQNLLDPDLAIYSGGFFGAQDKQQMQQIRSIAAENLGKVKFNFKDRRLDEMLFRFRARNYPHTLSQNEQQRWYEHCRFRLNEGGDGSCHTFSSYQEVLGKLALQQPNAAIIGELHDYATLLGKWIS